MPASTSFFFYFGNNNEKENYKFVYGNSNSMLPNFSC